MDASFIPIFFLIMLLFPLLLLALIGWRPLTKAFPRTRFEGKRLKGKVSGKVNNVRFKGFLIIDLNTEAIRLRAPFIFRIFQRPVVIPWSRISIFTETNFHGRVKFRMYINDPDTDIYLTIDQTKVLKEFMDQANIQINRPFF